MNWGPLKLLKHRELIYNLALRQIKIRYKQSLLGITWAILQPLLTMIVFTLVFSEIAKIPTGDVPYPIFSYSALVPWTFFATSLAQSGESIVSNVGLIRKLYFPREIFPLSYTMVALVDFGFAFTFLLILMAFYKVPFTIYLLLVPLILLVLMILSMGISLLASAINTYYRDVRYALPFLIQLLLFLSPIAYPVELVPERFRMIYMLNPLTGIIEAFRNVVVNGALPSLESLGSGAIVSLILLIIGYTFFKRVEMKFADII
ncbi:ABC transporter permease [Chloroflexota bacterium]